MTADHKTALHNRVTDVNRAIGSFPFSVPEFDSVIIGKTFVRLQIHREYRGTEWNEYRRLADLAASFSVPVRIEKANHSTRKQICVEFERLGVKFKAIFDIATPAARTLAKAMSCKLTSDSLTVNAAEFRAAVDALESA
ncbi:hypothetical protein [Lentzea cavernae]|uniref:Uncharacterized protein n=1 Tax=Lentzea cavernae TaxID=2020703 RepID=A0ABQ3MQ74_9PSEU|nr:hypothetical protein [Lentzea cavernae]GHH57531.1 hypothetical protein GCM10017774_77180 [Lentzea cavernae]